MGYAGNILPGYSVTPLLINFYTSLQYKSVESLMNKSTTLSLLQTKLAEKKTANYLFYVLHSSVSDLKSVIALSSRGGGTSPPCVRHWINIYTVTERKHVLKF